MVGAPDGRTAAVPPPRKRSGGIGPARRDGHAPGDRLELSPAARHAAGTSVATELTDQDVSLSARVSSRLSFSGRFFHGSPTMLQGGGLLKLDYDLAPSVTAFAGGGYLPGFYRHSIGPDARIASPHTVGFAGVEAAPKASWDLGNGFAADLGLRALGVATLAYNHEARGLDSTRRAASARRR